jgi:hypothetical protein
MRRAKRQQQASDRAGGERLNPVGHRDLSRGLAGGAEETRTAMPSSNRARRSVRQQLDSETFVVPER